MLHLATCCECMTLSFCLSFMEATQAKSAGSEIGTNRAEEKIEELRVPFRVCGLFHQFAYANRRF